MNQNAITYHIYLLTLIELIMERKSYPLDLNPVFISI